MTGHALFFLVKRIDNGAVIVGLSLREVQYKPKYKNYILDRVLYPRLQGSGYTVFLSIKMGYVSRYIFFIQYQRLLMLLAKIL
jgi:hypothetical protein